MPLNIDWIFISELNLLLNLLNHFLWHTVRSCSGEEKINHWKKGPLSCLDQYKTAPLLVPIISIRSQSHFNFDWYRWRGHGFTWPQIYEEWSVKKKYIWDIMGLGVIPIRAKLMCKTCPATCNTREYLCFTRGMKESLLLENLHL